VKLKIHIFFLRDGLSSKIKKKKVVKSEQKYCHVLNFNYITYAYIKILDIFREKKLLLKLEIL